MKTLPIKARTLGRRAALAFDLVEIFGVQVDCVSKRTLLDQMKTWAAGNSRRTILYVNAHCLNVAYNNPTHRAVLNQADLVYADGAGVVLASRLLGGCTLQKLTGRYWISDFCSVAAAEGLRLYFLAGQPGVAELASQALRRKWPGLQIVGTNNGYFSATNETEILADIAAAKPHVLFVGMNTPRQEKWIAAHRTEIDAPVCWAVGALFDIVAGLETPVPDWLNGLNLEWFWRFLMDPSGKWRRYLIGNPLFLTRLLRQRWGR
jgi:N-acetylglucosaminyldiphosphoundecaprenol N-acetyl-beta-D-mannosaminyltransferase